MLAVAMSLEADERLSRDERTMLNGVVKYILEHWEDADNGIWERRGPKRQYVHSKVLRWLALREACALMDRGILSDGSRDNVEQAMRALRRVVEERGYSQARASYVSELDGDELDAALLILPIVGFTGANEPRMANTIAAIQRELQQSDLVFRYSVHDEEAEGAFLVCSFWLVECLARQGRLTEAHELFGQLAARANDVGLLSEEIDGRTGTFLGNFPQAFSHVGLINAALTLAEVEENQR
jgi:GH15 family glucan-1,4-alpha-glucosidase